MKLDIVAVAAAELSAGGSASATLDHLLDVVLAIGNYMNGSTSRGQVL